MARRSAALIQRSKARVASLPAPVGGWNARDSIANMEETDAVTMVNMFPSTSNVVLRGGFSQFATGLTGQVDTLMAYSGGNVSQFFAIDESLSIFDVSSAGPVGAAVYTGLTTEWCEYANISTPGGNYLEMVNGQDDLVLYDGAAWVPINAGTTPAITGVATSDLCNIVLFKNRLWFIQKNTLRAWYLDVESISGTAHLFDLSAVAREGGHLVDLDTWTIDAGYGVDDNLAFITSNGEVIVYAGTDPSSASTFGLIGVWQLGSPIGSRAMMKYGGDLLILTFDGLLPMASALQSSRLDPRVALSDKIQKAISDATIQYGGAHTATGWQIFYYAKANAVWINVPVGDDVQEQYVMNTITKSWTRFTGWGANCWELYNDDPYFGGDGFVGLAWDSTYADDGTNINTSILQAFNYFGDRGTVKYFTRARTSILSTGSPSIQIGLNVDFDIFPNSTPIVFTPVVPGLWDVGLWDVATWGQSLLIRNNWSGITGIGYCGALQFSSASQGIQIEWASTDIVYQAGWAGI